MTSQAAGATSSKQFGSAQSLAQHDFAMRTHAVDAVGLLGQIDANGHIIR